MRSLCALRTQPRTNVPSDCGRLHATWDARHQPVVLLSSLGSMMPKTVKFSVSGLGRDSSFKRPVAPSASFSSPPLKETLPLYLSAQSLVLSSSCLSSLHCNAAKEVSAFHLLFDVELTRSCRSSAVAKAATPRTPRATRYVPLSPASPPSGPPCASRGATCGEGVCTLAHSDLLQWQSQSRSRSS